MKKRIAFAALGAFIGDNISYLIGRYAGQPAVKRFFSGEKAQARLQWTRNFLTERGSYILIVARFVPGGRTAATFTFDATRGLSGLFIPAGIAHGFSAVSEVRLQYLVDTEFSGDDELGFAWDDPDLGVRWPLDRPILSDRDRSNPRLAAALADPPPFGR